MADFGNNTVFSQTDASNNSGTVPTYAEGMAPSQVNDSCRALQGASKRDWDRRNPTIASTGSAPAYILTYTIAPAALYNGERYAFEANFTNSAVATTLNINGLGAKGVKMHLNGSLVDLPESTIFNGDHVDVSYDLSSDVFILRPSSMLLRSGNYTPTLTNVANITASTAYQCQYMRVGKTITVSGKVDIQPTADGVATHLGISLPIASNFGAVEDCGGTIANGTVIAAGSIVGDVANDRARVDFASVDAVNRSYSFIFMYQVI